MRNPGGRRRRGFALPGGRVIITPMIRDLGEVRRGWVCTRCDRTVATLPGQPGMPMHDCAGAGGMAIPYIPDGARGATRLIEREDYAAGAQVQESTDGRVYMAAVTETDEGEHRAVYAPLAVGGTHADG